jgi:dTDP-4-amino-4,6-dideoxygalactose transaminase
LNANLYIPFNRACLGGKELVYVAQAILNGHISGDGPFTRKCQAMLENELGVPKALLTTSCTDALEMAALLLEIEPGDEVILPSFTFVSTANAFAMFGAKLAFCDIRRDTLNLDEAQVEALVTPRTKAIVPVHYAGVGCEMDSIQEIAARHGVAVVEDNAHAILARYKGRYLGTFGSLATQSFHETKNFTCGEGGALFLNDEKLIERAEILRDKGTNRSRFFRGQVDKYTWVDKGSSYLPSDILAAFLCAQLEIRTTIQAARKRVWDFYARNLQTWATEHGVRLPIVPSHCEQNYHMFYLIMPSLEVRQRFIAHMNSLNIATVFHYLPLHSSSAGRQHVARASECPVTDWASDRVVRLPMFNDLTEAELERVAEGVHSFSAF